MTAAIPWTINNGQPHLQRMGANTPPLSSKPFFSYYFICSNVSIPPTPSTTMAIPVPSLSRRRPLPQRVDASAPALASTLFFFIFRFFSLRQPFPISPVSRVDRPACGRLSCSSLISSVASFPNISMASAYFSSYDTPLSEPKSTCQSIQPLLIVPATPSSHRGQIYPLGVSIYPLFAV